MNTCWKHERHFHIPILIDASRSSLLAARSIVVVSKLSDALTREERPHPATSPLILPQMERGRDRISAVGLIDAVVPTLVHLQRKKSANV